MSYIIIIILLIVLYKPKDLHPISPFFVNNLTHGTDCIVQVIILIYKHNNNDILNVVIIISM